MTFEDMLRRELNAGKSLDDVAKMMETALNQVKQETKAATKKKEALDRIFEVFQRRYEKKEFNLDDVGAFAVLCVQGNYPNWTVKDFDDFYAAVVENVKVLASMQGKNLSETLKTILEEAYDKALNKSKGKHECCDGKCTCGNDKVPVKRAPKTDADRIREFLSNL